MKLVTYSFLFLCVPLYATRNNITKERLDNFNIIIESKWDILDQDQHKIEQFGGTWVIAGSIIFKKKAKDPIDLSQLHLRWNGKKIRNLSASLYKKVQDKEFLAIEENLICDGSWNRQRQLLTFPFDKIQHLGPTTAFYLVLTVPREIENTLKMGAFILEPRHLPEPYKVCATKKSLSFSHVAVT